VKKQSHFAWLAQKLAPYLAPLIASEVARQLAEQQPEPPARKKFIGG
jgi:hypothetical protein